MKALTLALALIASPALAQEPPPVGLKPMVRPFQLFCADSVEFLNTLLREEFQEVGVVMSRLSPTTTFVLYVNEDLTTSSLVIAKTRKDREQACLVWSGKSDGLSYSTNPAPDWPEPKEGTEM